MTIQPITPLRQRMIEDMTIRRLKASTQDFYQRAVAKYAQHFRRSPGELDYEHVRQYQLHLAQTGCQPTHVNHMMTALRFFYKVTMGRHDALEMIPLAREPKRLRQILTPEEVVRLIEAAPGHKYRCVFSIAYGAGLRSSEVVSLKVSDIDSKRMVLRIEDGKGGKDRLAKLSPQMLKELRAWWKQAKPRVFSVSEPVQSVRPYQCPAISSCLPGRGDQGQDRPLRPSAHASALVRDAPARSGDRYSRYPSDART